MRLIAENIRKETAMTYYKVFITLLKNWQYTITVTYYGL